MPQDRRHAIARGEPLPASGLGAVLFADISGFTPLTNALVQHFGPRRGADELTRRLNAVYSALITEVERYGGSVVGFSGDAITCWFAADPQGAAPTGDLAGASHRAATAAQAMQQAMTPLRNLPLTPTFTAHLALKIAIAAGVTRRLLVGDPTIQRMDVLAGVTVDEMAAAEQIAHQNELVLDANAAAALAAALDIAEWRIAPDRGRRYAVVASVTRPAAPSPSPSPDVALPEAAVRQWVLPAIYARLHDEESRFLAEMRPATALFLRFSGIDYERDSDAGAKLDAYVRWVQGVVNRYEGALIQLTTGDKGSYFYATFGAPIAHDDDSRRAVAAALALSTPPLHLPFIATTQIGLSVGMMRTGAYGSASRRTYGVLGDETNMAARLMSQAQPGQILVSGAVAAVVADAYDLSEAGLFQLKGWSEPRLAYTVRGPRRDFAAPTGSAVSSPLVGREREVTMLTSALADAVAGSGGLVRIEGVAGVGKSHLAATMANRAAAIGLRVVRATCQSTSQDVAYSAAGQLFHALLRLSPNAPAHHQVAQIEAAIEALNPAWLVRAPLLGDLLGVAIPDNPTTAAFEPRLRQAALVTLAVEIVLALAHHEPLFILYEDIHWMDEASQGLLLAIARMVPDTPVLLFLVQRPPLNEDDRFLAEVAGLPGQRQLALSELSPEGLAALIRQRLQGNVDPLALALIQAQTQGNPFFAEELVDALCDGGQLLPDPIVGWRLSHTLMDALRNADCLVEEAGEWRLAHDAPLSALEMGLPNTVQGIVLARLDRLPEQAKLTLKVASVIGGVFEYELLAQTHPLGLPEEKIAEQLALLLARDFARVETTTPHLVYTFKHNITQEVAYQTLLEDQRQELHLRVAEVMEQLYAERVENLAFHYVRCDLQRWPVRDKALRYLDAAGQRAKREYANETALSYFNRALALEARWPWLKAKSEVLHILGRRAEQRETLALLDAAPNAPAFDTALLWGEYHEAVSEYEAAQAAVEQALGLARAHHDAEGEARCLARLGLIAWSRGDYETAERIYTGALAGIGEDERFRDEEAEIRRGLGLVYRQQGKYEQAEDQFRRNLSLNQILNNRAGEAAALNMLGHVAHVRRHYSAALAYYRQALAICKAIGDRARIGACLLSIAQGLSSTGDYTQAEAMFYEALSIYQGIDDRWSEIRVWNELGILAWFVGELAEARVRLERGLQLCKRIGDEAGEALILCNLGQILRDLGALDEAEAILTTGLHLAQIQGDAQLEAIYFSDLALVSLHANQPQQAIERATHSLALFRSLSLDLSTPADLATLATASLALHDTEQARRYVAEAIRILDACRGEGPDFPHRDYWTCAQVLERLGEHDKAQAALHSAHRLLMGQANKIADAAMRRTFLENIWYNRAIIQRLSE
ncbi:MAG: tetratricopeptide repeat protein [Caldilineaceae bacterium]|nr:tetratricopeptide repeat protein [Caldilineaceae bacterium]